MLIVTLYMYMYFIFEDLGINMSPTRHPGNRTIRPRGFSFYGLSPQFPVFLSGIYKIHTIGVIKYNFFIKLFRLFRIIEFLVIKFRQAVVGIVPQNAFPVKLYDLQVILFRFKELPFVLIEFSLF